MTELVRQVEQDIADTERHLTFWRHQQEVQAGTDLAEQTRRIVTGYGLQLKELQKARKLFDA